MTDEFPITIYHNPDCGTSRNSLAMIETAGYVPTVVEYRDAGWTRPLLDELLAAMKAKPPRRPARQGHACRRTRPARSDGIG